MFLEITQEQDRYIQSIRTIQIIIISILAMFLAQFIKFIIYSIRLKRPNWRMLLSTGGFPSSHTAFCIALCISMGMLQYHDGGIKWSFAVAIVFSTIIIHDAMGVRLEASKHAKILNNLASNMSAEEKAELGYGKRGQLKEMLGHRGVEVLSGAIVGIVVGFAGFFISYAILPGEYDIHGNVIMNINTVKSFIENLL